MRTFISFFLGSAIGLLIDLGGFALLHALGVAPWLANVISSTASITAVYLLVTRYTFGVSTRPATYLLFLGWYGLNITVTSTLIQLLSSATGLDPFIWKLISVPVSFTANFLFSRFLFAPRIAREAALAESHEGETHPEGDEPEHEDDDPRHA